MLNVVVAEAPDLPGCFTQGISFEGVRENLIDAIEVWIISALQCGEELPVVNGYRLPISAAQGGQQRANPHVGDIGPALIRQILHRASITAEQWDKV